MRAYVQKLNKGNGRSLHRESSPNYINTLFLNMRARSTISVCLICFTKPSSCLFLFPFWDNLIATSSVKRLVFVKSCKTVAEYDGLDTSLLSKISISRIRNVLKTNCSEWVKEIKETCLNQNVHVCNCKKKKYLKYVELQHFSKKHRHGLHLLFLLSVFRKSMAV
jgi:hypothetical protein